VGRGVLGELVDDLAHVPGAARWVLIADDHVAPLHAAPLARRLRARGLTVDELCFPAGERHKVRESKIALEDRLSELGAGRDTWIVAVGGGVTGDLAGFVAATWHRGIPFVQVPTSLLAMVDAAIGGKTAVDIPAGKNLVGSFHQPWGVYADVDLLSTLPDGFYAEGLAEAVKTAVVADGRLFRRLEQSVQALRERDPAELESVVLRCAEIKSRIVRRDEREAGPRAALNFGHTVAHALERATGFELRHGQAVAIGMTVENLLAREARGFPEPHVRRVEALLDAFGLPVRLPSGVDLEAVVTAARSDKKARAGRVRYALPTSIGRMPTGEAMTVEIDERVLRTALRQRC